MPSTPSAYPQVDGVISRRFASSNPVFSQLKHILCARFDSRQLHYESAGQGQKPWPVFVCHQDARLSSPSVDEEGFYARIELDEHRATDLTKAVFAMIARADDAQEGMCASLEKRPATWHLRQCLPWRSSAG